MNGKKAKSLRRKVYGKYFSPRYRVHKRGYGGALFADPKRREYQDLK